MQLMDRLVEIRKGIGMFSMMHLVPYSRDQGSCNKLLQIAVQCNTTSLNNLCNMQYDFG